MDDSPANLIGKSANVLLGELGERLGRARLGRNLTQARLAEEAGVSVATVHRLESGHSVQLANWLRVLVALGLDAELDALIPKSSADPLAELERAQRQAKRRRRRASRVREPRTAGEWVWGEDR